MNVEVDDEKETLERKDFKIVKEKNRNKKKQNTKTAKSSVNSPNNGENCGEMEMRHQ